MHQLEILDFTDSDFGLLVTRSEFWLNERFGANEGQIGIVVDKEFVTGRDGRSPH